MSRADAIGALLRRGRPIRFLFEDDARRHAELAVKCASCRFATDKHPDRQCAFCIKHEVMVGTTTPVLCTEFKPA